MKLQEYQELLDLTKFVSTNESIISLIEELRPLDKLPCGCHCQGGCGDPYAACMYPCEEHVPF